MKNLFTVSLAALLVSTSGSIQAQELFCGNSCGERVFFGNKSLIYLEALGGVNFLKTNTCNGIKSRYHPGYIVASSLGYRWCGGINIEIEYAFRRNEFKNIKFIGRNFSLNGHFQSSSYMGNWLWNIPTGFGYKFWNFKPYVGAGMGYDFQQVHGSSDDLTFEQTEKGFAWQVMTGLSYPLFCNTMISLEYKLHQGRLTYIYSNSLGVSLTHNF